MSEGRVTRRGKSLPANEEPQKKTKTQKPEHDVSELQDIGNNLYRSLAHQLRIHSI